MRNREHSFALHLLRGAAAVLLVLMPAALSHGTFLRLEAAALPLAFWMLRGCPLCWTLRLFQMAAERIRRAHPDLLARTSNR